jgi:hypothetical protein
MRGDGGGEAGGAEADDHDIGFQVPSVRGRRRV